MPDTGDDRNFNWMDSPLPVREFLDRASERLRQIEMLRERGTTAHQFVNANTLDAIESWMNAVTGMLCNHEMPHPNPMKDELVSRRDAAIAAMRKGEA